MYEAKFESNSGNMYGCIGPGYSSLFAIIYISPRILIFLYLYLYKLYHIVSQIVIRPSPSAHTQEREREKQTTPHEGEGGRRGEKREA